jgi:hypothetical protein
MLGNQTHYPDCDLAPHVECYSDYNLTHHVECYSVFILVNCNTVCFFLVFLLFFFSFSFFLFLRNFLFLEPI